jgi:thiamine-phosphate pyrophosphorylase
LAAIGGVDASNGAKLIGAGADMLAVISAVFYTEDTFKAASDLNSLFDLNSAVAG